MTADRFKGRAAIVVKFGYGAGNVCARECMSNWSVTGLEWGMSWPLCVFERERERELVHDREQ